MSNELRHNTVGAQLSQAEFEDVALHIFNSQATGDILYASSATQLTRLGIGAANTVLHVAGGIPEWSATLAGITLTAPTINGTVATTGLTLPAFTLNGALNANTQNITNITQLVGRTNESLYIDAARQSIDAGGINIRTTGVTPTWTMTNRLSIGSGEATVVAAWANVNHNFGSGTITTGGSACVASFGPAAVTSITVKNGLITAIS